MIFPWVNWGWKGRKNNVDTSLRLNFVERYQELTEIQREYDSRLHHFESTLKDEQYQLWLELRTCASKLLLAKDRVDFATNHDVELLKKGMGL